MLRMVIPARNDNARNRRNYRLPVTRGNRAVRANRQTRPSTSSYHLWKMEILVHFIYDDLL